MVLLFVANLCWRLWSGRLYTLKHNYINIHHIIQIFAYTMLHPRILSYLSYTFKALQADFSARDAEQTATIWGFVCCFYHQKSGRKNPSSFNSLYIDIYWKGSLCYQPKQCTRKWTIPQIYHTFALFDLINMGPRTATRTTTTSYAKHDTIGTTGLYDLVLPLYHDYDAYGFPRVLVGVGKLALDALLCLLETGKVWWIDRSEYTPHHL